MFCPPRPRPRRVCRHSKPEAGVADADGSGVMVALAGALQTHLRNQKGRSVARAARTESILEREGCKSSARWSGGPVCRREESLHREHFHLRLSLNAELLHARHQAGLDEALKRFR